MGFCKMINGDCAFNGEKREDQEPICCESFRACCYSCDDLLSCDRANTLFEQEKITIKEIPVNNEFITQLIKNNERLGITFLAVCVSGDFLKDGLDEYDAEVIDLMEEYDFENVAGDEELLDLLFKGNLDFKNIIFFDRERNLIEIEDYQVHVLLGKKNMKKIIKNLLGIHDKSG